MQKNTIEYLGASMLLLSTKISMKMVSAEFRILVTSRKRRSRGVKRRTIHTYASLAFVMTFF